MSSLPARALSVRPTPARSGFSGRSLCARLLALPLGVSLLAAPVLVAPVAAAETPSTTAVSPAPSADTAPQPGATLDLTMGGEALVTRQDETDIGPGVRLTQFERLEPGGWQRGAILDVDLTDEAVSLDYLYSGEIASTGTVSELAAQAENIAGAVNGDFFAINSSGAPIGIAVDEAEGVLKTPSGDPVNALVLDAENIAHITRTATRGAVAGEGFSLTVEGVNPLAISGSGVAVFTSQWGSYQRLHDNADAAAGIEVLVDGGGTVLGSRPISGEPLPTGVRAVAALPGTEPYATLAALAPGDQLQIAYGLATEAGAHPVVGLGSGARLVEGGVPVVSEDPAVHPRTAVGVDASGTRLLLTVVDGRSAQSRGMSLTELGRFLAELGAHSAINFDGGGSTTLVARDPGQSGTSVVNTPSDGTERSDANALGVAVAPGSGVLADIDVEPADTTDDRATRVFPGLRRSLRAEGVDENVTAVDAAVDTWASSAADVASVAAGGDDDGNSRSVTGIVTGIAPGDATITAASAGPGATGSLDVRVLGPLARLEPSRVVVGLPAAGDALDLRLTGLDARGFSAPIDVADIDVEIGEGFTARPLDAGTLEISSTLASGSTVATLRVGGHSVQVPVTVGTEVRPLTDLADAEAWTFAQARATGTIGTETDPEGDVAVRLTHDFAAESGTRGAYAIAPGDGIPVPGSPIALTMQMRGDGTGAWPRLQALTGDGTTIQLNATEPTHLDFQGWQPVTFRVPEGTVFPLTLQRVRIMETRADARYQGDIAFSDLSAVLSPDAPAAASGPYEDPEVDLAGDANDEPLRIAVVSDAQFVAANPQSPQVDAARAVLRQAVAQRADRVLILGDWVDEGGAEDIALARRIIDEELGATGIPWTYVPGNHEAMGAPDLAPWRAEFGAPQTVTDVEGTRILTLNSAPYTLSHDPAQLRWLRARLDEAVADPAITGVVLALHHPTRDEITGASALTNAQDAALVERWMAGVVEAGKSGVVVAAGVGAFDVRRIDGVTHVTNGNAGKTPNSTPARGGFSGWTMLGIDPDGGLWRESDEEWLDVEVKPFVDGLTIDAPGDPQGDAPSAGVAPRVRPGDVLDLDGTVAEGGRLVPAAWPVSVRWHAEQGAHTGAPGMAPADAVVALDVRTGELTGLDRYVVGGEVVTAAPGLEGTGATTTVPVRVWLTVNGVTAKRWVEAEVPVARAAQARG